MQLFSPFQLFSLVLPFFGMFRQTFPKIATSPLEVKGSCWQMLKTGNWKYWFFVGIVLWLNNDFVSRIINWWPHINLDIKTAGTVAIALLVSYKASDLHVIKWKILLKLGRQLALEKISRTNDPKRTFLKSFSEMLHVTFCDIAQQ